MKQRNIVIRLWRKLRQQDAIDYQQDCLAEQQEEISTLRGALILKRTRQMMKADRVKKIKKERRDRRLGRDG